MSDPSLNDASRGISGNARGLGVPVAPPNEPYTVRSNPQKLLIHNPNARANWNEAKAVVLRNVFGKQTEIENFADWQAKLASLKDGPQKIGNKLNLNSKTGFARYVFNRIRSLFYQNEAANPSWPYTLEQRKIMQRGSAPDPLQQVEHMTSLDQFPSRSIDLESGLYLTEGGPRGGLPTGSPHREKHSGDIARGLAELERKYPRTSESGAAGKESDASQLARTPQLSRASKPPPQELTKSRSTESNPRLTSNRIAGPETESQPAPKQPDVIVPSSSTPARPHRVSGEAKGAGLQVLFVAVGAILTAIGDEIQRRDAEAAFKAYAPSIAEFLQAIPELGALIVFKFTQQVSNPSGEASLISPGLQFRSVDAYYGHTRNEAERRWQHAAELDVDRTRHVVDRFSKKWIPPLQPRAEKRKEDPEPHPVSTAALIREIKVDLKPPPNFLRVFHHLNGSSMKQMLQTLNELKRSDQLDPLTNNFDKAEGVNRGRIRAAIKATKLRGSSDAFHLFMTDEQNRLDLSGVEEEGRKAIERVLLTNKDN